MADEQTLRKNTERFMQEVFNDHNLDSLRELLSDDFVEHAAPPGWDTSKEGAAKFFEMLFQSFPDLTLEVHEILVSGDRVGIRSIMRGTNTGELAIPGVPATPATGKTIEIGAHDIVRANEEGLAAEHWGIIDGMGMMQQLGLIPPPPTDT
jgi:predicted ester cyclase